MVLSENKKPRFKNRGLCCGPIRANGSNQVDLSSSAGQSANYFQYAGSHTLPDEPVPETFFSP